MVDDTTKKISTAPGITDTVARQDGVQPAVEDEDPFSDVKRDILKRFELLPETLKTAIMDDNYQMQLFEIAKAHKLTYEQLSYLEMKTTMVLLGMLPPEDYRDDLQIELKKNDPDIDSIVKDVNENVFAPIRISIQKVYEVQNDPANDLPSSIVTAMSTPKKVEVVDMTSPIAAQKIPVPQPRPATVGPDEISPMEKSVLEKSGVVLSDTPMPPKAITAAMPMPDRADILAGIENPSKTPQSSIVANKLGGTAPMPQTKTTDYSLPKTSVAVNMPITPAKPGVDPYREKID